MVQMIPINASQTKRNVTSLSLEKSHEFERTKFPTTHQIEKKRKENKKPIIWIYILSY